MQRLNIVIRKKAGIALMEVVLGIIVVTIAIAVLMSTRSSDTHTRSSSEGGHEAAMLINNILKYSANYANANAPPYSPYDSSGDANSETNLADLSEIVTETDISSAFIEQLTASGIVDASAQLTATDDPDDCKKSGNSCSH